MHLSTTCMSTCGRDEKANTKRNHTTINWLFRSDCQCYYNSACEVKMIWFYLKTQSVRVSGHVWGRKSFSAMGLWFIQQLVICHKSRDCGFPILVRTMKRVVKLANISSYDLSSLSGVYVLPTAGRYVFKSTRRRRLDRGRTRPRRSAIDD